MSRKATERRRARLVIREEAELRADFARLTEAVAGCTWGERCPCHYAEWQELQGVRFLLGEDITEEK